MNTYFNFVNANLVLGVINFDLKPSFMGFTKFLDKAGIYLTMDLALILLSPPPTSSTVPSMKN